MPTAAPAPPRDYRAEFPIFRRSVYLNSCSLGALSTRSRAKVNEFLDLWDTRGAAAWYEIWWAALTELRARYARWIGAPEGSVALHPSISAGLTSVAESLDYRRRPKVVVTSLDFPTLAYQWLARAEDGVELVIVESPDGIGVPVEAVVRAVDGRTALVATSHVFFTSGAIQDVRALADLVHAKGALLLVDGYHAAGQLPVDVRALDVDFYCSGGLKWLLGGTGVAFMYARPELWASLTPRATGWFAHREQFRFDPRSLELHGDSRRLEAGTPPLMPVYAQLGGLDVLEELGAQEIRRRTAALAEDLIERARAAGLRPKVAARAEDRTAIVMLPSADPAADVRRLAEAGIVTDSRPGHVRVSPYFYNVPDDHRAAIERLTRD
jgi:selenocysteine lyase/cysteine desulfurase